MGNTEDKTKAPSTIIDWAVFKSEKADISASVSGKKNAFIGKNKRRSPRTSLRTAVKVWLDCGVVLEGCATDISLTGVSFTCSNYLPVGNPVRIEICTGDPSPALNFKLGGSIARIHEGGLAVAFAKLQPDQLIALDMLISSFESPK